MAATAEQRREHAALAARASWAKCTDRTARTAKARAAAWQRFLDEADGDPVKAEELQQQHYRRMRANALQTRSAKKAASANGETP